MNTTLETTYYVEFSAAPQVILTLLSHPKIWETFPLSAKRSGGLWHWNEELYTVSFTHDGVRELTWEIKQITRLGPWAKVRMELHDATIASHAVIRVEIGGANRLTAWWLRRRVRRLVEACCAVVNAQAATIPVTTTELATVGANPFGATNDEGEARYGHPLADELAARYPQTVAAFTEMGAFEHLERVWRLEQSWERMMRGEFDRSYYILDDGPAPAAALDFDLIYAGGGLGLLHAAVLAKRHNYRILLFDRSEVGCAHREWNISRTELEALVATGVVTWEELGPVIMREYRDGLVRFYTSEYSDAPPSDLWLPDVLNVALDAGALLRLMRRKFEEAGGTVLSQRAFRHIRAFRHGPMRVEVELAALDRGGAIEHYSARLLLDGMGSTSPLALLRHHGQPFAGVCPTVGTVAHGFVQGSAPDELDPTLGDILISVADAQHGEQLMWEGFPGRDDELTVYLFYYATIGGAGHDRSRNPERHSLMELFEQYFTLLPTYKRPGPHFAHLKPVYGYIPARHIVRPQEVPLLRGVLAVGDAAAQQSPLTFCGFGSHVRNLERTTNLLDYALSHDLLDENHLASVTAFQTNVSLNWVFSRFMRPWAEPHDVNRLQNLFLASLQTLGTEMATRFFQDRMRWSDYLPMLIGVLKRFPNILMLAWRVLGVEGVKQWIGDYTRFTYDAARASVARKIGRSGEGFLVASAERLSAGWGLRVRARYAEWRAMGWVD